MLDDPRLRMQFFTGQFLEQRDFNDLQDYHIDRQRRHNRTMHTPGIADGLDVTGSVGQFKVQIAPGTAIDREGRQIILTPDDPQCTQTLPKINKPVYIVISYGKESDSTSIGDIQDGKSTRKIEIPAVEVVPQEGFNKDENFIKLALIEIDDNGIKNVNKSVRINAGANLADGAVTTPKIADNSVTTLKIQNGAITQDKLAASISPKTPDGSVGTAQLADTAVTTPKIADNSVTTLKIQNGAITQDKLAASISPKIPDGSVGTAQLADNAIITGKIADKSITVAKLNFSIPSGSSQWQDADGGSISYSNGNVGIGTKTPKSLLEIRKDISGQLGPVLTLQNGLGSVGAGAAIDFNGHDVGQNDPTARIQSLDDNFSSHLAFYTKQSGAVTNQLQERLRIKSNGNVGIGIPNPGAILEIFSPPPSNDPTAGGYIRFFDKTSPSQYECTYNGGSDGIFAFTNLGVDSGGTIFQSSKFGAILNIKNNGDVSGRLINTSSRVMKENITNFSTQEAIETLVNLNPVKFNYREDNQKQLRPGFIAEDVPELVATADRKGICTLDIVAVLTKVIQNQQEELSCLKKRLNALEAKV